MALFASGVRRLARSSQASDGPSRPTRIVHVEPHDHEQLELRLAHGLPPSGARHAIDLNVYVFVPRNVGVTAANYPRDDFYSDLTTYLRLDLPSLSLDELASDEAGSSPLVALHQHLSQIGRGESFQVPVATEVKLFGHAFNEAVRLQLEWLLQGLRDLADRDAPRRWAFLDEVDTFCEAARAALCALRRARRKFEPFGRTAPAAIQVFHFTDEYSSLYLDGAMARLALEATQQAALFDGSGFVARLQQTLARHAEPEAQYREAHGYLNFGDVRGAGAEYFAYRQSILKKAVQNALYVDARRLRTDTFVRNATGALAAGLAATWALVAQLPAQIEHLPPSLQAMLFGLPVIAYIGKDRLKEISREWLQRRLRSFDIDTALHTGSLAEAGLGAVSGRVRERMRFLSLGEAPADVVAHRFAQRTVNTEDITGETAGEGVLAYSRRLELSHDSESALSRGMGLLQILRLNLRHFFSRLDDPEQGEFHYSSNMGRFHHATLPKVYHLNVVIEVQSASQPRVLRRWRVVMNKSGIVRLEHVA